MKVKQITASVSVSEQITSSDLQLLVDSGVQLVINNRPDGEEENQPTSQSIEQAALSLGLEYIYMPIANRNIPNDAIEAFESCMNGDKTIHAYCRTGTRSSLVWAMAQAKNSTSVDIINLAKTVEIDLTAIEDKLNEIHGS